MMHMGRTAVRDRASGLHVLRHTSHAEDLPVQGLPIRLGIGDPGGREAAHCETPTHGQTRLTVKLHRMQRVRCARHNARNAHEDSRFDVDLVHLHHVDDHAVRGVQLLVALAALPVLACACTQQKITKSRTKRAAPSRRARSRALAFLVLDQRGLIAKDAVAVEAEDDRLLFLLREPGGEE